MIYVLSFLSLFAFLNNLRQDTSLNLLVTKRTHLTSEVKSTNIDVDSLGFLCARKLNTVFIEKMTRTPV